MHIRFIEVIEQLEPSFQSLIDMSPLTGGNLPKEMPQSGIYLFSEGSQHLYVGRSNTLRKRYGQHCNPRSRHNQAVFAFKLARKNTGKETASYVRGKGTRAELASDELFRESFIAAKLQVRNMDYRYVEVADQRKQALLEIYCAIVLECPYYDFKTS